MKIDLLDKYKNITEMHRTKNGIIIKIEFSGMPQFKITSDVEFMEFNNEEDADKYLSENMHNIEIMLYKTELYACYKHIENQRHELHMFNNKRA